MNGEDEDHGDNDDGSGAYDEDGDVYETQNYNVTGMEATFEELDMGQGQEDQGEEEEVEDSLRVFGVQENESIWGVDLDEEMNMRIEQVGVIHKKGECEVNQVATSGTHVAEDAGNKGNDQSGPQGEVTNHPKVTNKLTPGETNVTPVDPDLIPELEIDTEIEKIPLKKMTYLDLIWSKVPEDVREFNKGIWTPVRTWGDQDGL